MPRLHLISPVILTRSGHDYQVISGLRHSALSRGWECDVHVARTVSDPSLIAELAARPTIDHFFIQTFSDALLEIGASNYKFYKDLIDIGRGNFTPEDALYVSMIHHRNMFGLMKALDEFRNSNCMPRLSGTIWTQQCFDTAGNIHHRNSQFFKQFFGWLAENRSRCAGIYAFSEAHLDHLNTLGAAAAGVEAQGHIMAKMPPGLTPQPPQPGLWRFGYFGNSVSEQKGLAKLLEAARTILSQRPDTRFTIQFHIAEGSEKDSDGLRTRYQDVISDPRVTLLDGNLTATQYFENMAACDIIVLPYGPYYDRIDSGIFQEAVYLGKPPVLPETSQANRQLRDAGASTATFGAWNGQAIAQSCLTAIADYEKFAAQILDAAPRINRNTEHESFATRCGVVPLVSRQ